MLPNSIISKAIELCDAGLAGAGTPAAASFAISVHAGAALARQFVIQAEAKATVRDLITLGADFEAGPLAISGRDFAAYGVTPASVFDVFALSHIDDGANGISVAAPLRGRTWRPWSDAPLVRELPTRPAR